MRTTIYSSVPHKLLTALVIVSMVLVALPVMSAYAAETITVTTTTDEFTGAGNLCSLREAIALANTNAASANDCTRGNNIDPDDIIVLQSGFTYTLTRTGLGGTSVGDLDIGDSGGGSGNLTIESSGSTRAIIDGGDIDRVLDVDASGDPSLALTNITITNGNTTGLATTTGGGISFGGIGTLTLTNSVVSNNVSASDAGCGGGIYNNSGATVVITDSTISGNSCPTIGSDGGGIFKGGGTDIVTGGSLTITDSTVTGNTTAENGGGVHIGVGTSTITVNITNSTFASNTAGNRGGGLQVGGSTAVVTVDYSTFSGNIANEVSMLTPGLDGGGALQVSLGSVTVTRSILADSIVTNGVLGTPRDCHKAGTGGPIASVTDSILETNSVLINNACTGSFTSGDPSLGALASNGGPTQTMSISTGSLAYNAIPAASCGSVTTDQRGFTRPQVTDCDMGSYEAQNGIAPTVLSVVRAGADPTNDATVDFTVTFSEAVTGLETADFPLAISGVTGTSVSGINGSGAIYTVTVNTGTGDGTIQLNVLDDGDNSIQDIDTNPLDGGFTGGEFYTIDKTAPTISSITRADNETMGTDTVDFGVAFSEAVTGVTPNDFSPPIMGGSVSGATVTGAPGLGTTYTVTVNTGSGDGTLGINLDASGTGIVDAAGNGIPNGGFTGEVYTILKSAALIDVEIGGTQQGSTYTVPIGTGQRDSYVGVDDGPVKVESTNGVSIVSAVRNAWSQNGVVESWVQLMGLPETQLSNTYYFPAYNNVTLSDQLRFANLGDTQTTVTVEIGTVVNESYVLQAGEGLRVSYPGVDSGPVTVSSDGQPIIAALRNAWSQNGVVESWVQLMGLPETQLSTTYYFPAYNNVTLSDQLRFANLGNAQTTVTVKIGSVVDQSYVLQAGESLRVSYPGVDAGPVTVSSDGQLIIAAVRNAWSQNGIVQSWAQLMGLPASQLSDTYYFPAYNNVTLSDQLRFANLGNAQTTVTVKIGSVVNESYVLQAGESLRVSYPGVDSGPVTVSSDGELIIAALRNAWSQNGIVESWAQLMGLPASQLSDIYYFPAYNNVTLSDQLRFAMP